MKPVDYVVLALSGGVLIVILLPVLSIAFGLTEYNETRGKEIAALLTSIVAIISIYVGAKIKERD